jgi:hypothetical protein
MSSPYRGPDPRVVGNNLPSGQREVKARSAISTIRDTQACTYADGAKVFCIAALTVATKSPNKRLFRRGTRVKARAIDPNCPRYIPKMQLVEPSIYAPRAVSIRQSPLGRAFRSSRTPFTSGGGRTMEPISRRLNRRST